MSTLDFKTYAEPQIFDGLTLPIPLSKSEERVVLERVRKGDDSARESLIEHNLRLVVHVARGFEGSRESLEDLVSTGIIGLCEAAETFDISKGVEFSTYAVKCIQNEILQGFRHKSVDAMSLDEPRIEEDGENLCLLDIIGTEKDLIVNKILDSELAFNLQRALSRLSETDKTILTLKYGLHGENPINQYQIAKLLGFSRQTICKHKADALNKLRRIMELEDKYESI